jgi:predicted enzyme related to lactoylglutathione lyase
MIKGVHAMVYTSEPEATRAFFRDKLKLPYTDVGQGWLVFDVPGGTIGCHPVQQEGGSSAPHGTWGISFYCDDIHATVAELKERGVEFAGDVKNVGFGLAILLHAPGGLSVMLYQPLYR